MSDNIIIWSYDCETDGISVEDARIVTASLVGLNAKGDVIKEFNWIINTGREMPPEPAEVHGYTTERMQAEGMDGRQGIADIAATMFENGVSSATPVVIYNAGFDTTILDRNLRRHKIAPRPEWGGVIDPLVIDKGIDKYRKGSRKLVNVAAFHGVTPPDGDAHEARYDCILAGRLALKMRPTLRRLAAADEDFIPWLMKTQSEWKAEQASSLQSYLRSAKNKNGADPEAIVDPSFPMTPFKL